MAPSVTHVLIGLCQMQRLQWYLDWQESAMIDICAESAAAAALPR